MPKQVTIRGILKTMFENGSKFYLHIFIKKYIDTDLIIQTKSSFLSKDNHPH